MSTRSNILFRYIAEGKVQQQLLTYRHSDGYPTGVVPDLINFLKWNEGRNDQFDYLLANYFYYNKRISEAWSEEYAKERAERNGDTEELKNLSKPIYERKMDGNEAVLLGYGIDIDGFLHVDIEYFYIVDIIEGEVKDHFHRNISIKISCYVANFSDWDISYPVDEFINTHRAFKVIDIPNISNFEYQENLIPKKYRY